MKNKLLIVFVVGVFLISLISAAEVCCEKTISGKWCENSEEDLCDSSYGVSPNSCEETNFCETGCCIDSEEGLCSNRAVQEECEESRGVWEDSETCDIQACEKGCCIFGNEKAFVTQTRCSFLSEKKGVEGEIDWELSRADCRTYSKELGACKKDNICRIKTEEECALTGGEFYFQMLCSNPSLETGCEKQDYIGCVEGKDEIYWFDSCGNQENIYSSNKDASWNNGEILSKEDSCNPDSGNINSETCGNCNSDFSSMCSVSGDKKVRDGNYVCESLGCDEDGDGSDERKNGEGWCVYDSYVGEGNDFFGSTHWKRTCVNGEIIVEDCGNQRQMICAEKEVDDFSIAQCRINLGATCFGRTKEECETIPDCILKNIDIDDYFNFSVCVPKYNFGFDLDSRDDFENGNDICGLATQTCNVLYEKKIRGLNLEWVCEENCDCLKTEFAEKMNELCLSMGDCGGYLNTGKEYNNNFYVEGKKYKGLEDLQDYILDEYLSYFSKTSEKNSEKPQYIVSSDEEISYIGEELNINDLSDFNLSESEFTDRFLDYAEDTLKAEIFSLGGARDFNMLYGTYDLTGEILRLIGVGDTKQEQIKFNCLPMEAPFGGNDCEKCNEDPLKPCSKYRCESLGQACKLVNEDIENPVCINVYSNDSVPPIISAKNVFNSNYHFKKEGSSKASIEGGCLPEYILLNFSLETDEHARCYADFERANSGDYSSMNYLPLESNKFSLTHNFNIRVPSINSECIDSQDSKIYIVCEDYMKNFNLAEYVIDFCIEQGEDLTPPIVIATNPSEGRLLPYGVEEFPFEIILNEPSKCRYSYGVAEYESMSNMICEEERCQNEYSCLGVAENASLENKIYVKCNDSAGNMQDYEFDFYATENNLQVDSVFPFEGTIIDNNEPFYLEIKTSGGANSGTAICSYKFDNEGWSDTFTETNSNTHRYKFTNMGEGDYSVSINCEDDVGNVASGSTQFSVELDETPPIIVRAYNENDYMKLITNEEAICYYDYNNCNFDILEKSEFATTSFFSTTHLLKWNPQVTYYVKCEDDNGNVNTGCAMILKSR